MVYRKTVIIIIIILIMASCSTHNESITTCKKDPYVISSNTSELEVNITVSVYNKGDFITKTVMKEENKLKEGIIGDLEMYAAAIDNTYNGDIFQVEGFEYSSELKDDYFTYTATCDYTKLNNKELSEKSKKYFYGDFVDKDFNVLYDKYIDYLNKLDFVCK